MVSLDVCFSIPRPQCPGSGLLCWLAACWAHCPLVAQHAWSPAAAFLYPASCHCMLATHPHTSNIYSHAMSNIAVVGNATGRRCEVYVAATDPKVAWDDRLRCDRRVTAFLRGGGEGRRTQCSRLRLNFAAKALLTNWPSHVWTQLIGKGGDWIKESVTVSVWPSFRW